jgi:hypothetical protein
MGTTIMGAVVTLVDPSRLVQGARVTHLLHEVRRS